MNCQARISRSDLQPQQLRVSGKDGFKVQQGDSGTHFLLLHEFCIGNVIHHILPKNRCCQYRVYLFRVQIPQLSVEYELVAFWAEVDRDSSTK